MFESFKEERGGILKGTEKNLEKITRIFFNQRRKMIKKPLNKIFNSVQIDTSAVISLSVSNAGNDTLKITEITSKTTNFSVLPEEATVPAGDSVFIAVTFSPDTIDTYTDTLTIMSNSSQRNIKILSVPL